jgi:hypothetical protein
MRLKVFRIKLEEISIEKKSVYFDDEHDVANREMYHTKSVEEEYHFSAYNISDKLKESRKRTNEEVI